MTDIETITTRLADAHGVHYTARDLTGRTDRPSDLGGTNAGLMASEHVLVALASCTTTTAVKIAKKRSVALTDVRIAAHMDFDDRGEPHAIRVEIDVDSDADEAAIQKVVELAERACTIRKLLALQPTYELRIHKTD